MWQINRGNSVKKWDWKGGRKEMVECKVYDEGMKV